MVGEGGSVVVVVGGCGEEGVVGLGIVGIGRDGFREACDLQERICFTCKTPLSSVGLTC